MTEREEINEAIREAHILECACERFDVDHMLFVATKLSGFDIIKVKEVYSKDFKKSFENMLTL